LTPLVILSVLVVMLSEAKHLSSTPSAEEILRCAQDDILHFKIARPLAALAGEKGVRG
jgi:hypothetical protein